MSVFWQAVTNKTFGDIARDMIMAGERHPDLAQERPSMSSTIPAENIGWNRMNRMDQVTYDHIFQA